MRFECITYQGTFTCLQLRILANKFREEPMEQNQLAQNIIYLSCHAELKASLMSTLNNDPTMTSLTP